MNRRGVALEVSRLKALCRYKLKPLLSGLLGSVHCAAMCGGIATGLAASLLGMLVGSLFLLRSSRRPQ